MDDDYDEHTPLPYVQPSTLETNYEIAIATCNQHRREYAVMQAMCDERLATIHEQLRLIRQQRNDIQALGYRILQLEKKLKERK